MNMLPHLVRISREMKIDILKSIYIPRIENDIKDTEEGF